MLLHDKATTTGSLIGVVAIVFLVGQQIAVLFGLFTYMSVLVDHSGSDIWVISENTENINSSGMLPDRYVDRIKALPEVRWTEPLLFGSGTLNTLHGQNEAVQIVGVRNPQQICGPWRFYEGSSEALFEYEGITVDKIDLKMFGNPRVGDVVEINDTMAKIVAITDNIKGFSGRLVFTNYVKASELLKSTPGRCRAILVKAAEGASIEDLREKIRQLLPETNVLTTPELSMSTRLYYVSNTGMGGSFGFSTLVGAMVGIIIITLTMYTSALQRQKDFAVLRAFGARKYDIFLIVLSQAVIISLFGIFLGFILLALFLYATLDTQLPCYMPLWIPPILACATLMMSIVGSVFAMRKAISVEPASVFR